MVTYSKTAADLKKRIRDMVWLHTRVYVIITLIILLFSACAFLIGFLTNEPELLRLSFQALVLVAVFLVFCINLYCKVKKAVTVNFEKYEVDGKIDFTIEKIDENTLEFTRLTDEESFQITMSDIKSIQRLKFTNVIILKDKRTIDLPKSAEIVDMICFL